MLRRYVCNKRRDSHAIVTDIDEFETGSDEVHIEYRYVASGMRCTVQMTR